VAWRILSGWKDYAHKFAKIFPVEYRQVLAKQHLRLRRGEAGECVMGRASVVGGPVAGETH